MSCLFVSIFCSVIILSRNAGRVTRRSVRVPLSIENRGMTRMTRMKERYNDKDGHLAKHVPLIPDEWMSVSLGLRERGGEGRVEPRAHCFSGSLLVDVELLFLHACCRSHTRVVP